MSLFFKALMAYSFSVFLNSASRTWTQNIHYSPTDWLRTTNTRRRRSLRVRNIETVTFPKCPLPRTEMYLKSSICILVDKKIKIKKMKETLHSYLLHYIRYYMCSYFRADTGWSSLPSVLFMDDCRQRQFGTFYQSVNHIPISTCLQMFLVFFSTVFIIIIVNIYFHYRQRQYCFTLWLVSLQWSFQRVS